MTTSPRYSSGLHTSMLQVVFLMRVFSVQNIPSCLHSSGHFSHTSLDLHVTSSSGAGVRLDELRPDRRSIFNACLLPHNAACKSRRGGFVATNRWWHINRDEFCWLWTPTFPFFWTLVLHSATISTDLANRKISIELRFSMCANITLSTTSLCGFHPYTNQCITRTHGLANLTRVCFFRLPWTERSLPSDQFVVRTVFS